MTAWAALLRGVNVGGHKAVKMAALKELCTSLKLQDVQTHLQSGNVIFTSDAKDAAALAKRIEKAIEKELKVETRVIVRSAAQLASIVENNPFDGKSPAYVVVFFTADPVGEFEHDGPEEVRVVDGVLYVHYPDGQGKSKLTGAVLERKLKTVGTARNWNTVTALARKAAAGEA